MCKEGFTHFVFIADDLLLNPRLTEHNFLASLTLEPGDAYIPQLRVITDVTFQWPFLHMTLKAARFNNFFNAEAELPTREEAFRRLAAHGVRVTAFGWKTLRCGRRAWGWEIPSLLVSVLLLYGSKVVRRVVYPLAMSYSDFLVVPAAVMADFCHYCGVFAAMGIFVECAIPVALALAAPSIKLERDIPLRGVEHFDLQELAGFESEHGFDLPGLLAVFPPAGPTGFPRALRRLRRAA